MRNYLDLFFRDGTVLPLTKNELSTLNANFTGKSFSEALIFASTNPQYDKILFIELQVQCLKIPNSEHIVYINCSECQNKKTICVDSMF